MSDELGMVARPLEVWSCRSKRLDARHVADVARRYEVVEVVVGVPRRLDGTENEATVWARAFVEAVRGELVDVPVVERDEALTSWEAERRLKEMGRDPRSERARIDAMAAAVILQEVLDERSPKRQEEDPDSEGDS